MIVRLPRNLHYILLSLCLFLNSQIAFAISPNVKHKSSMIQLEELTIERIHKGFVAKHFTAEEIVQAYFLRIEQLDPQINALTTLNKVEALRRARQLDKELQTTGKLRPLHGIPVIVKDNINTKNLPTTAGSKALEGFIPDEDAFVLKKLYEAGAIMIAKSNMAEWAFSPKHTKSSTGGITRNPYNLLYVPAGSSGGTAAAITSNVGVIGLGTDTGNSIRGPSSHNALVGFRPTLGLVSRSGIIPLYLRNDTAGPMTRTVEDATRALEILAGIDPLDPLTKHSEGKAHINYQQFLKKDGLSGARIGVFRQLSDVDVDPEIKSLFDNAVLILRKQGAVIIDPLKVNSFDSVKQNQWCDAFRQDIEQYLSDYVKDGSVKTLEDIIKAGTTSTYSRENLDYFKNHSGRYYDIKEDSQDDPFAQCENAYQDSRRIAFRDALETAMNTHKIDAIIYPTWNHKPALIEAFNEGYKGDNSQIIAPHTGQPAFTVPMGFVSNNLPVGLQFLGRMYSEPTLIRLAYSYEQATLHRRPPH